VGPPRCKRDASALVVRFYPRALTNVAKVIRSYPSRSNENRIVDDEEAALVQAAHGVVAQRFVQQVLNLLVVSSNLTDPTEV
jgi:hypothetical protein